MRDEWASSMGQQWEQQHGHRRVSGYLGRVTFPSTHGRTSTREPPLTADERAAAAVGRAAFEAEQEEGREWLAEMQRLRVKAQAPAASAEPPARRRRGRPRHVIDAETFEQLAIDRSCSLLEVARALGVSDNTVRRWCYRTYGEPFSVVTGCAI